MRSKKTQMTHVRNKNISDIFVDMKYLKVDHECLFQQSYASNLIGKEKGLGKSNIILASRRNRGSGSSAVRHLPSIYKDLGVQPWVNVRKKRRMERKKGGAERGRETGRKIIDLSKDIKSVEKKPFPRENWFLALQW